MLYILMRRRNLLQCLIVRRRINSKDYQDLISALGAEIGAYLEADSSWRYAFALYTSQKSNQE